MNGEPKPGVYLAHEPDGKPPVLYRIVYVYEARELLLENVGRPEAALTPITAKDLRSKEWRSIKPAA